MFAPLRGASKETRQHKKWISSSARVCVLGPSLARVCAGAIPRVWLAVYAVNPLRPICSVLSINTFQWMCTHAKRSPAYTGTCIAQFVHSTFTCSSQTALLDLTTRWCEPVCMCVCMYVYVCIYIYISRRGCCLSVQFQLVNNDYMF